MKMTKPKDMTELKLTRKAQQGPRNAYHISIPKRLAELRGITPGQEGTWRINKEGKLELTL